MKTPQARNAPNARGRKATFLKTYDICITFLAARSPVLQAGEDVSEAPVLTINAWVNRGLVPGISDRTQGVARMFDLDSVLHVAVMAHLVRGGDRKSSAQFERLNLSYAQKTAQLQGVTRQTVQREVARGAAIPNVARLHHQSGS